MFVNVDCKVRRAVVVAPTGSGKTTAILNNIPCYLKHYRKVFLTFPTKSLMQEVSRKLSDAGIEHLLDNSDVRLSESISLYDWVKHRVIVASYEKLDSVLLMNPELAEDSLIVIDEVHLATDDDRALAILSLLATAKKLGAGIIVMSATVPNYTELAGYLNAEVIVHSSKVEKNITFIELDHVPRGTAAYLYALTSRIEAILHRDKAEYGRVLPTIVFRPSRRQCEVIAETLRMAGFDARAYHAGVPAKERVKMLKEFNEGKIDVLVSTHALCWGVNTPAMRVIIAGSLIYRVGGPQIFLKTVDVVQMAGRAGRPGYMAGDITPEVVIITTTGEEIRTEDGYMTEKEFFQRAISEDYAETIGLKSDPETIILRLIKAKKVKTVEDITRIPEEWFNVPPKERFVEALSELKYLGLVEGDTELRLTKMGSIVAEHYLSIREFRVIRDEVLHYMPETRFDRFVAVCRAVADLYETTLKVPEAALDDSVVISIGDERAREVAAQLVAVTGDTDKIAETIKKFAFFLNRVCREIYEKDDDDWYILGKTMTQIRSMVFNNLPIKGVVAMYIDGKIDQLYKKPKKEPKEEKREEKKTEELTVRDLLEMVKEKAKNGKKVKVYRVSYFYGLTQSRRGGIVFPEDLEKIPGIKPESEWDPDEDYYDPCYDDEPVEMHEIVRRKVYYDPEEGLLVLSPSDEYEYIYNDMPAEEELSGILKVKVADVLKVPEADDEFLREVFGGKWRAPSERTVEVIRELVEFLSNP